MRKHYERILHDSESRVQRYLDIQILDENSPFCGGFPKADSLAEPKTAIYRATTMTACYLNPESRYYLDAELGRRLTLALAFVRRSQRPGGYFDLINCNFFSGPDTAFCTKRLLPAYVYLCKVVDGALPAAPEAKAAAAELKPKYEAIIRDAADALCHCGFHTPNHRWAIASVLMLCAKLFDKPECRTAAEAILKEGNDCNEDGEYAERSAGNYNRINLEGAIEVTPYQLVGAYGAFANGGYRVDPYLITKVVDRDGKTILEAQPRKSGDEKNRIITKENAAMVDSLLKGVVRSGTARAAQALGRSDIAGKTGTTNDSVDAWFAGYQPNLVGVAWMGFDTGNKSLGAGEFGGGLALPIWMDYMRVALQGKKIENRESSWGAGTGNILGGNAPVQRNPTDPSLTIDGQPAPPIEELKVDPGAVPLPGSEARQSSEKTNEADVKAASEKKLKDLIDQATEQPAKPTEPRESGN